MTKSRIFVLLLIACTVGGFFLFDLDRYLNLAYFQSQRTRVLAYFQLYPIKTAFIYILAYVVITGLSLPGAGIMTLIGGAIFGLWWGTLLAVVAATIGATIAFLVARFLLHDYVQQRFQHRLAAVNQGIRKDGAYYLFSIRMVPVFPYFIVNLLMGLTPIRIDAYVIASLFGMVPASAVFVNAGTQLAKIDSLSGILSPQVILSLCLLALFPLMAKFIVGHLRLRGEKSA